MSESAERQPVRPAAAAIAAPRATTARLRHAGLEERTEVTAEAGHRARLATRPAVAQLRAATAAMANRTGMPVGLKAGVEALSGIAMDDVRVHYNSPKPAQLQAHAFAQGTNIHLAPGREKDLPHEAWHVVQQKQGRVKATRQMKAVAINDDEGLEREADTMGARAASSPGETAAARTVARPDGVAQLRAGDTLVVTQADTPFYATRAENDAKIIERLKAGVGAEELAGRTDKWVKLRLLEQDDDDKRKQGWVLANRTVLQPGMLDRAGKIGENTATHFTKLVRAPFVGDPSGDDVKQGGLGDCWLLAPLAAIADTGNGKTAIKAMIKPHDAAAQYKVRFYVPRAPESAETEIQEIKIDNWFAERELPEPVEAPVDGAANVQAAPVAAPEHKAVDGETAYATALAGKGIWPLIAEKAAAQLHGSYEEIDGGLIGDAYRLVTGQPIKGYAKVGKAPEYGDKTETKGDEELKQILAQAEAAGKPTSVHIPPKPGTKTAALTVVETGATIIVAHDGVIESSVTLTYPVNDQVKTFKGGNPALEVLPMKPIMAGTLIAIKTAAYDPPATGAATVAYTYTDIGGISGGHVYQFHSIDGDTVSLVDPHDTSQVTDFPFDQLAGELNAAFFVGDVKVG